MLPWGDLIEDFLEPIGVSLEGFRDHMTGGWAFGYVDALARVGVETDLICVTARTREPVVWRHGPTRAGLFLLPASRLYRTLRRRLQDPYAWTDREAVGDVRGVDRRVALFARHTAPYCSTPVARLAQLLRKERYDALLVQEYEYPRFDVCTGLGRLLRVPVFATFQGGDYQLTRFEPRLRPVALDACNGIIVGSSNEAARVRETYGLPQQKIARIFNPFDVEDWGIRDREVRNELDIPSDAKVVAWHGRVELHRKGLDVLCHAWALLAEQRPEEQWHLLLVGTGSDAAALRTRISALALPRVHWIDDYVVERRRIRRYLAAADLYAFPSRHEGFPVAPIEAMASGLPLVAADAPGVADILEHGADSGGIVVPREDGPVMADALARLLADDDERERMGRAARRRAEEAFGPEAVGRQLRDFFEAGIGANTASALRHPPATD